MKLNIYLLSHPLIQNLCNVADESLTQTKINNNTNKLLGLFIIYETIRKWIKVYHLTIKQVRLTKEKVIIDPKESYIIIFNNLNLLSTFQEIQSLLPKINLELIKEDEINENTICQLIHPTQKNRLYTKIIIVNYEIDINYVSKLVDLLINQRNISIDQIYLTCIKCKTNQLIELSKSELYKNLAIYTTKIIKN